MSFSDFLFNGQTPPAVTSTSNQGGSLPLWYSSYLSTLANKASDIAGSPYQSYDAPRIAPKDAQETQAYDYMGQNANNWQAPMAQAQGAAGQVAGGFDEGQFNKYMSPYMSNVTNEIGRLGMQNLNENLLPTLNAQFVGSGGSASSMNRDADARLIRDTGANILGQQGMAMQGGFQSAMQNYNAGNQTQNAAAQNLGNLAQTQQGLTTGTAGALSASGATNRGFDQANMDLAYQDFQNQLNYPRQNVSFLSNTLHGMNVPTSQDESRTGPFTGGVGPSPLSTFAGMTLAGLGAGQQPKPVRTGGYVARLARGGLPMPMPRGGAPLARPRMRMPAGGGLDLMRSISPRSGAMSLMAG